VESLHFCGDPAVDRLKLASEECEVARCDALGLAALVEPDRNAFVRAQKYRSISLAKAGATRTSRSKLVQVPDPRVPSPLAHVPGHDGSRREAGPVLQLPGSSGSPP